jgi:hypothetical protein
LKEGIFFYASSKGNGVKSVNENLIGLSFPESSNHHQPGSVLNGNPGSNLGGNPQPLDAVEVGLK